MNDWEVTVAERFISPRHVETLAMPDTAIESLSTLGVLNGSITLFYVIRVGGRELDYSMPISSHEWFEAQAEWARGTAADRPSVEFERGAREAIEAFDAYFRDEDERLAYSELTESEMESFRHGALLDALRDHRAPDPSPRPHGTRS
jgi:hypothetical protein